MWVMRSPSRMRRVTAVETFGAGAAGGAAAWLAAGAGAWVWVTDGPWVTIAFGVFSPDTPSGLN